ncbi:MAG: dihydrolipoamide acetyltransferase family protein [bacterium]|nr:dihydrolipoamide acetyltransferase family protein [bacterium]MDE0642868.1 dihydrolipoamide acetyltransferase family protein [bacterium]
MPYIFKLPDIGDGLTEADIVRWRVEVGRPVEADEVLVEVETAKAVVEIPSPAEGTVLHHGADEGQTLPVGEVLAVIGGPDEVWPEPRQAGGAGVESEPSAGTRAASPASGGRRPSAGGTVKALPVVRRLAREMGVDLSAVIGSGPDGSITREDVKAAARGEIRSEEGERIRLSMLRRTVAEHMSSSWRQIPHATIFHEVDATGLLSARRLLADRYGRSFPMEALVVRVLAPLLKEYQVFNATLDGEELVLHPHLNVGIAVDTDHGLLVPVIPAADQLGLMELVEAISDIAARGKARSLTMEDMAGLTFTITNIGAVGGSRGTPIIPMGTTAILAIGRAADAPVVREGTLAIAPMMPLSLAFDHRVIDGGLAQRFLNTLVEKLENPPRS